MRQALTALIFLMCTASAGAQLPATGFSREFLSPLDRALGKRGAEEHPAIQPAARYLETSFYQLADSSYAARRYGSGVRVEPMADLAVGMSADRSVSKMAAFGSAGAVLSWNHRDRLTGTVGYAMAGGQLPAYYRRMADSTSVIPGWGYAVNDGNDIRHVHIPFGHIGVRLGKFFHLELGNGRHFWGDGRRSLILSDVASPYPYLRLDTRVWKIKYTNLWARMDDIVPGMRFSDRRGKYVALHGLSWNISRDVNFTLFEMVIWQDRDSLSSRTLDMHYFNPVLFFRPVEYAQGSADNVLIGAGFRFRVIRDVQLYTQIVIDEFLRNEVFSDRGWWANKYGGQAGVKWFDAFTPGLHLQAEANLARPFTYTHGSSLQAWGHMRQPLAHPMGANFYELMFLARYSLLGWTLTEQVSWANYGRDLAGENQGGDIFRSYRQPSSVYGNYMMQGARHAFHFHQFTAGKPLGKEKRFEFFVSHTLRYESGRGQVRNEHMLLAGIRAAGTGRNVLDF
jgi:hypothetical protein